jgi:hypothetical protein
MKKKHGAFFGVAVLILAAALIPAGCIKRGQDDLLIMPIFDRDGGSPVVTGVTVSPGSAIILGGETKTFSALVAGTGNPAQTVTWTVSGKVKAETGISSGGVLSVHSDEPDGALAVTATSTVDPSKSGAVTVRVGYIVGDEGPAGGIIFYVDSDDDYPGWKYLEAAPEDIPGDIAWASSLYTNILIPGGTSVDIGKGRENTAAILATDPDAPAAKACAGYGNSTDEWFLPSLNELHEMYINRVAIGGFSTSGLITYWSSSEDIATQAWRRTFENGSTPVKCLKNATTGLRVRPVRRFPSP